MDVTVGYIAAREEHRACSDQAGPAAAAAPSLDTTAQRTLHSGSSLERPATPSAAAYSGFQWSSDGGSAGPSSPSAAACDGAQSQLGRNTSPRRQSSPFDVLLLAAQMSSEGRQAGQRRQARLERRSLASRRAPGSRPAQQKVSVLPSAKAAAPRPCTQATKRAQHPRPASIPMSFQQLRLMLISCTLRQQRQQRQQQQRLRLVSSGVATAVASLPPQDAAELNAARAFLSLFKLPSAASWRTTSCHRQPQAGSRAARAAGLPAPLIFSVRSAPAGPCSAGVARF